LTALRGPDFGLSGGTARLLCLVAEVWLSRALRNCVQTQVTNAESIDARLRLECRLLQELFLHLHELKVSELLIKQRPQALDSLQLGLSLLDVVIELSDALAVGN